MQQEISQETSVKEKTYKNYELGLAGLHGGIFFITIIFAFIPSYRNAYIYSFKTFRLIEHGVANQTQFYTGFTNLATVTDVNSSFKSSNYYNTMLALGTDVNNFANDGVCYSRSPTQQISWGSSDTYYSTIDNRRMDKVSKWGLICTISAITSLAHLLRYIMFDHVHSMIRNNVPRWDRWFEYSLTSPLMIILIAYAAGTIETSSLLLLYVTQTMLVVFGLAIEIVCYEESIEKKEKSAQPNYNPPKNPGLDPIANTQTRYQPLKPISIKTPFGNSVHSNLVQTHSIPSNIMQLSWTEAYNTGKLGEKRYRFYSILFFVFSWMAFVFMWTVIIWNLSDMLSIFKCVNSKDLSSRTAIPIAIVTVELIFFILFGLGAVYFAINISDYGSMGYTSSIFYNVLSLTSKFALIVMLIFEAKSFNQTPN
eukprot:746317-Hanusia_phi.AAC.6